MKIQFPAIFLIMLLCSSMVFSLTWEEALDLAQKNNHELKSAKKEVESAEWTYKKAFSLFLPQLSASASMNETGVGSSSASSRSYSMGLSGTQYLFRGMSGIYGIQSAYAGLQSQKASYRLTESSVLYDVRYAFVDLYVAQENVKLLEQILKQRKDNSRLIQLRYDSGKEDKGNLMSTQADEKQSEYDLSSAVRDLTLSKLKISQLLGVKVEEARGELLPAQAEKLDPVQYLESTPSFIIAKYTLESSEIAQKETISGFLPSVSLSASHRKSGSDWPPGSESNSWSLSLSYSFFPGGSNFAERAIYGARLDKAREDFEETKNDLTYELQQRYNDLIDALEALEVAKVSLMATEERAKIARVKYLNGLMLYDEWDRIENNYIQAQKSLLSYRKAALSAEALWHKTYGGYIK